jgi:hypothetical protein
MFCDYFKLGSKGLYNQFNYEVENMHMEIPSKDPMKDKRMN